eukprot:gene10915-12075_t
MSDCMALCCSKKHCNIAYMKNTSCFGVTCLDVDKCNVQNNTIETGTKLALMIRNEMNRRGIRAQEQMNQKKNYSSNPR